MKLPIFAFVATAIMATSALGAPNGASLTRPPQLRAPGNFRRSFPRNIARPPFRVIGRSYYPFWGGFCSNSPLGPLVNPQWYYCYPGYAWDYGEPYYWASYLPDDSLVPSTDLEAAAAANSCGDWVWDSQQKKYSWDEKACQPAAPSP